MRDPHFPLVVF